MGARLAQSVEHQTFNLRVMGSSPISGDHTSFFLNFSHLIDVFDFLFFFFNIFKHQCGKNKQQMNNFSSACKLCLKTELSRTNIFFKTANITMKFP